MQRYTMQHYTLTAPTNVDAVREGLMRAGILGWTEVAGRGKWCDDYEDVVIFHFYSTHIGLHVDLAKIGRKAMPDEEAIQITWHGAIDLWEDRVEAFAR